MPRLSVNNFVASGGDNFRVLTVRSESGRRSA